MSKLGAFFREFFEDKQGYLDEKRLWGNIFLAASLIYTFTHAAGPGLWTTAGGLAGIGSGLLLAAGAQDGIIIPKGGTP